MRERNPQNPPGQPPSSPTKGPDAARNKIFMASARSHAALAGADLLLLGPLLQAQLSPALEVALWSFGIAIPCLVLAYIGFTVIHSVRVGGRQLRQMPMGFVGAIGQIGSAIGFFSVLRHFSPHLSIVAAIVGVLALGVLKLYIEAAKGSAAYHDFLKM